MKAGAVDAPEAAPLRARLAYVLRLALVKAEVVGSAKQAKVTPGMPATKLRESVGSMKSMRGHALEEGAYGGTEAAGLDEKIAKAEAYASAKEVAIVAMAFTVTPAWTAAELHAHASERLAPALAQAQRAGAVECAEVGELKKCIAYTKGLYSTKIEMAAAMADDCGAEKSIKELQVATGHNNTLHNTKRNDTAPHHTTTQHTNTHSTAQHNTTQT